MKLCAIVGCVIKTSHAAKHVVAIICEARVLRDLLTQRDHLIKNVLELFHLLQAAIGYEFPSFLSQCAIGLFEVSAHLNERFFLAAKLHGERAAELLILLTEF